MGKKLDRRSFLTGTLAVGALATGGALIGCSSESNGEAKAAESTDRTWDKEADVVVVGAGFAGLASAITASDEGSSVILIEKAPEREAGGNSRVCAQAVWSPANVEKSIQYFKEITSEVHLKDLPDDVIEAYITESAKNHEWLSDDIGLDMKIGPSSAEFPLAPSAGAAEEDWITRHAEGLGKSRIWNGVMEAAQNRSVEFFYEAPLTDLIFNEAGEVIGVEASEGSSTISIAAHKGVVLCCGGFEFNEKMKANYLQFPSLAWGTPYNTGDGIDICMAYDIDFWHMNSATPATRIGLSMPTLDEKFANSSVDFEFSGGKGYFWTDKYGKRFMNESRSYQHGYGRNSIFYNDSMKMEWPRVPMWQVFDTEEIEKLTSTTGWLTNIEEITVSEGLADEIAAGVVFTADTPEELAQKIGVEVDLFVAEFNKFNEAASTGVDAEFARKGEAMRVLNPPFYAAQVYPVMVNTNGGPVRNANAQILKTSGEPVPRLYSSGEFGSVWAWYYQGAGNIGECMAFGRIAGRHVSALDSWKGEE